MKCKNPFINGGQAYGCGQCLPCRIKRRREWTHRIILEALQHSDNAFVTLTYSTENLKTSSGAPWTEVSNEKSSVNVRDVQLFMKRLRTAIAPLKVRFFAVGEYGDETERPHYHAILFGFPTCSRGRTYRRPGTSRPLPQRCCDQCRLVSDAWGKGDIDCGIVEKDSCQYVAGYTVKKMTGVTDERLCGRNPEFARMSLKPGIGLDALHEVASVFMQYDLEKSQSDVPVTLRHGALELPLGRYLRRKLRLMVGRDEKAPPEVLEKLALELFPLRMAARKDKENPSFKKQVINANKGAVARVESRQRLFKGRKSL